MYKKTKTAGSRSTHQFSRRKFITTTTTAAAAAFAFQFVPSRVFGANERLGFAGIGVGGKGGSDINHAGELGDIIAICDIDNDRLNKKGEKFPSAAKFHDFREMLEKHDKEIDAVMISTPDHTHAVAASMAMKMGKHVYVQKPLTHDVWEARHLRLLAKEMGVCTQMGNQGTAADGFRRSVELIQAGHIGDVTEVHIWTNRPVWPQSPKVIARFTERPPIPDHIHWNLFIGTAPHRPYHPGYTPFKWRGWWDFGTGALGDMACHTANMAFMALKLESPLTIKAKNEKLNDETFPGWASVVFEFPARGDMPPVKLFWYEGHLDSGELNLPPLDLFHGNKPSKSGSFLVGTKGNLYSPGDYGNAMKLLPSANFTDWEAPAKVLARNNKGDAGQKMEWVEAIKANKPSLAFSNFDYAGMLTETILLGNVAMKAGRKLKWNADKLEFTNHSEATAFLKRTYENGWSV